MSMLSAGSSFFGALLNTVFICEKRFIWARFHSNFYFMNYRCFSGLITSSWAKLLWDEYLEWDTNNINDIIPFVINMAYKAHSILQFLDVKHLSRLQPFQLLELSEICFSITTTSNKPVTTKSITLFTEMFRLLANSFALAFSVDTSYHPVCTHLPVFTRAGDEDSQILECNINSHRISSYLRLNHS